VEAYFKDPANVSNIIDMLVHVQVSSSRLHVRNLSLSALQLLMCSSKSCSTNGEN
jgi:hypothetical protein